MNLLPQRRHYAALFLLSAAILVLEIAVARTLSVALLSHYAFVAISLAMFGLGLSALAVYLWPAAFPADRVDAQVSAATIAFGVAAAVSLLAFLRLQVVQEWSWAGFATLTAAYLLLAVPFFLGGLGVALLMTHYAARIGAIYAADLLGAGLGCLLVVLAMNQWPAPHVAVLAGAAACAAAAVLAPGGRQRLVAVGAAGALLALFVAGQEGDLLRLRYVKVWDTYYATAERWNAFSRIAAFPSDKNAAQLLPLRGANEDYADRTGTRYPRSMNLDIDGTAWTPMLEMPDDPARLAFLRDSVLYIAHHLRPQGSVLVIGTGGGRDLLAARAFGERRILGIELNPLMREMVQEVFADYSGQVYTLPGIEVVIDEARSRLSRVDERFAVIQLSLIDTFSLNAAGGFVFSENFLYTTEAFREYYRHLTDDGILTLSRYFAKGYPIEIQRILGMIRAAWEAEGAGDVRGSVIVLWQGSSATVLARRTPFTAAELAQVRALAAANEMIELYVPGIDNPLDAGVGQVLKAPDPAAYYASAAFLLDPPTDDRPFFFNLLRGRIGAEDLPSLADDAFQIMRQWDEALRLLYLLVAVVTLLAVVCFLGPLLLVGRRTAHHLPWYRAAPLLLYFACLGYGFMIIEIPLMQRFVLLLGYPTYSLAVVLFSLLLFSGIGSWLSTRVADPRRALTRVLPAIVALGALYALIIPALSAALLPAPFAVRLAFTVGVLALLGVLLGMAYPLGIGVLRPYGEGLVPWAWGLNGALSVVASVLAIVIGSRAGFTVAMVSGIAVYALALVLIVLGSRPAEAAAQRHAA